MTFRPTNWPQPSLWILDHDESDWQVQNNLAYYVGELIKTVESFAIEIKIRMISIKL
jgi:hypothetical protein